MRGYKDLPYLARGRTTDKVLLDIISCDFDEVLCIYLACQNYLIIARTTIVLTTLSRSKRYCCRSVSPWQTAVIIVEGVEGLHKRYPT